MPMARSDSHTAWTGSRALIVPDQIERAAKRFGSLPAIMCQHETRTFAEIDERSTRLANALLALGLKTGDRVVSMLKNSIRCVELDFGLAKAGLVRVSVNPRSTAKELAYIAINSDAKCVIYGEAFASEIEELREETQHEVETWIEIGNRAVDGRSLAYERLLDEASTIRPRPALDAEDLYCLFYTSGTTGRPKGVMLSHRAILQVSVNLMLEVGPQGPGEKVLLMQPMSHGAGFFVLPWFVRGGISVIMEDFDVAETIRLAKSLEIETIKLVPTMLQRLLRQPELTAEDFPRLRQIIYGASPMPAEALREALSKFGGKLVQIYGQSEAPVTLTCLAKEDHVLGDDTERLTSAGLPWPTIELKVLGMDGSTPGSNGIGEIVVRAPHVMSGYWKLPQLTSEVLTDGWLRTNDMGRIDESGFVYLVGRRDEMIISGGYNIAPREVEEILYLHPAVQEAAVVGEPDPEWGNSVIAYVALKLEANESQIIDFVKSHIGFKRPKRIYRVTELPKNANGKILKSALTPQLALGWKAESIS